MSWESQIANMSKRTLDGLNRFYRKVSIDVFKEIVERTPVDTGRLRANWVLEIGTPDTGKTDATDPTGQRAISQGTSTSLKANIEDDIWITNNLEYAEEIEFGRSTQAPEGMVRITVARWNRFLEDNKNELE